MATPFDFIKEVFESPGNAVVEGKLNPSELNRFIFLRGLGFSEDSALFADYVQTMGNIPNKHLFTIMHELVQPKTRRRTKWAKEEREFKKEEIEYVVDALQCSSADAFDILRSLNDEELKGLLSHMEKVRKEKKLKKGET